MPLIAPILASGTVKVLAVLAGGAYLLHKSDKTAQTIKEYLPTIERLTIIAAGVYAIHSYNKRRK